MVTFGETIQLGENAYRVTWSSDLGSPPPDGYRVYRNGVLAGAGTLEEMDFTLEPGESLVIEVLDEADQEPATAFPNRMTLGWKPVAATREYRVEEYVGGSWIARKAVPEDGSPYYRWESRPLEDDTTHQFRVIPVGTNGNDGSALSFSALMVRYPDPPIADADLAGRFSYDPDAQEVTISDA
ncbi:MAG: hypothetical protein KIS92_04520 [Planctomycetota bacterium]|nr:hypothetical protein [Planctomycetota bacterium]